MSNSESEFLLAVRGFSGDGRVLLEKIFPTIEALCTELKTSSIYRVRKTYKSFKHIHDIRSEESYDGLVSIFRGKTKNSLRDFFARIKSIEATFRSEALHRSADLTLLVFDYETVMTPELTIPHPEFHRRPEELVPASEMWGGYKHPILQETLDELARRYAGEEWGEFYSQGITSTESREEGV